MRPWQHAKSGAATDRDWKLDLPIHEFLDSTKWSCPDLRHRMILHNSDLGPELVARAFPQRVDGRRIAIRHVREDLGCTPTLSAWLSGCEPARMPTPLTRRLHLIEAGLSHHVARSQGIEELSEVERIHDLLTLPMSFAGAEALPILFNSFGLFLARIVLGPARASAGSRGGVFDPAHVAEAMIHAVFGRIPALPEIIAAVNVTPREPA